MTIRRLALLTCVVMLAAAGHAGAGIINVPAGGDLQAALDRAQPGDVITLQPGATYVGNFTLNAKGGGDYITVRSASPDHRLPPSGVRVSPAASPLLARIQSPNGDAALRTAPGARSWRLLFLEFGPSASGSGDIIRLGDGSSAQQTRDGVPTNLVVDRCYIHGDPANAQRRGIALNSGATWILNSWISDIKASDQDSQAIAGWNGPGPYTIENNYLEAAGENILFGGGDASIDGLVPTGITIRRNWIRKPLSWRNGPWQVKNLLELKNARGVVIESNLLENNWQAAQPGYAILFTPRNQDGRAPWSAVQDVTFRGNVVRHVAAAINILGHDSPNSSQQTRGITIQNNLFYDVNAQNWGGNGNFLMIGDGPADVRVEHNTALQTGNILTAYGGNRSAPAQVTGFVFRDNIALHNEYGMKGDDHGVGNSTLAAYFPSATVSGNVFPGGQSSLYPSGNVFPSVNDFYAQLSNPSEANYQLVSSSSLMKASSDGGIVGVDPSVGRTVLAWAISNLKTARPRNAATVSIGG